ncbi:MAG TPA: right-handed parallel beta-helix repeat-containing protein, partial [Desulfobacteraceae bacterium]|nr:right-handed parallel beta-helix repeat-containing protein [Desulfobacteraceae bacterium]
MLKKTKQVFTVTLGVAFIILLSAPAAWAGNVSGSIASDTIWNASGSPHIVTGDVTVEAGAVLTINSGVQVKFDSGFSLIVEGTLNASGTKSSQVLFTSNQSSPAIGDWNGIRFKDNSAGTLGNCVIEYAGIGIHLNGDGTPLITGCTVRRNNRGIEVYNFYGTPQSVVSRCSFYGNTEYNYYVYSYGSWNTTTLNARNNYWGVINPQIINQRIYDYIDDGSMAVVDYSSFLDSDMNVVDVSTLLESQEEIPDVDLADLIAALQISVSLTPSLMPQIDPDEDGKVGLPEAIYVAQVLAGLRFLPPMREYFLSGIIFEDTTLDLEGSPYTITKNVRVLPGVTLTIEPGVKIEFEGNYSLWVDGRIDANGTEATPITFTSARSNPSPGNWQGIYFGEGATGNISYSVIEYANRGIECYSASPTIRDNTIQNTYRSGVYLTNSSASVENNTIQSNGWGMALHNSSPPVIGNTIRDNDNGILIEDDSYPTITDNSIHDNSDGDTRYDIKIGNYKDGDTVIINAAHNWWGATALSVIEPNIYDY